jgi:hypothetical protein
VTLSAAIVLLAVAAAGGASPPSPSNVVPAIAAQSDTVRLDRDERVGCLRRRYLLVSTVEIHEGERILAPGVDYVLDADAGCFTLLGIDTLRVGRTLVATYRALPLALDGPYRLREDPHRRRPPTVETPEPATRPAPFTGDAESAGLALSGSKTLGIEVGNRSDLKLRQTLDLKLTGQVTRDVSLLAILSDQDIPFEPEGNTAELEEIDRILVQVKSPRAEASLGDVALTVGGLAFLDVRREMEGFTAEASVGPGRARGAVASAKGEYASRSFFGIDGKQGPYRLTDRADSIGVVVVAGSEKIWFDGALLARGEENDYVIDYGLGEITFTGRRPVTANTQISVDYQFATSRYRRRVSFAGGESRPGARLGVVRAGYFREGDSAEDPFGGELSEAERDQLAALGDSASASGGPKYRGPNGGDYRLVVDPATGREIYVFLDGTGEYDVTFVSVGEGRGDYAIDAQASVARTVYRFVGEGEGSYVVRRDLPAPERREVGSLRWDLNGSAGKLAVEGAIANADRNVLSPLDDGDNQGGAFLAEGTLSPRSLGRGIVFTPHFRARRTGEGFDAPARLRPAFFARQWNLTGTEQIRDESLGEAAFELRWKDRLRWSAEGGRFALADTFTALRQRQGLDWNDERIMAGVAWTSARDEVGARRGELDRVDGNATWRAGWVRPRVTASNETRRRAATGAGERHRDWQAALFFPRAAWPVEWEIGVGRRLDDSLQTATGTWRETQEARTLFASLTAELRSVSAAMRYEARRVDAAGSGDERRDLGRLDLRHRAMNGAWSGLLTVDIGTEGVRRRSKTILPALSDSAGYFDRFGNYVGSGGGYDVVYGLLGEETLTGQVEMSTRLRWSPPGPDVRVAPWMRKVAWEGFATLNEASLLPLVTPRYFLSPGSYLSRRTTVDGRLNERQTIDLFPLNRGLGARLRQEANRRVARTPGAGGSALVETSGDDTYAATLRATPGPGWDTELEGSLGSRREEVDLGGDGRFAQTTDLRAATVRGGRRIGAAGGNGRVSVEATYSEETGRDRDAAGWVLRPRLQWSLSRFGRLDVRYARTTLLRREGFIGVRGPGAPSLTEGWRFDLLAEARLREGVVLTAALALDHPRGLGALHEGRLEVRGSF